MKVTVAMQSDVDLLDALELVRMLQKTLQKAQEHHKRVLQQWKKEHADHDGENVIDDGVDPSWCGLVNAETEAAYRRGYMQGAYRALRAFEKGAKRSAVSHWAEDLLLIWRLEVDRTAFLTTATLPPTEPGADTPEHEYRSSRPRAPSANAVAPASR